MFFGGGCLSERGKNNGNSGIISRNNRICFTIFENIFSLLLLFYMPDQIREKKKKKELLASPAILTGFFLPIIYEFQLMVILMT